MPRWQDRGEVEDSDDEDLCLGGNESQTTEVRSMKITKLLDESNSQDVFSGLEASQIVPSGEPDEEAEEDWLNLPKVTTTYGTKEPRPKPTTKDVTSEPNEVLSPVVSGAGSLRDSETPTAPTPQVSNWAPTPRVQVVIPTKGLNLNNLDYDSDSSGLSSPPSELEISPPSGFVFPRGLGGSPRNGTEHESNEAASEPIPLLSPMGSLQAHAEEIYAARRSLRARQEKQLHPYMYDKAQYQQQWRARGLKPVHYAVTERAARETQDDAFMMDESQSQGESAGILSSPHRASSVTLDGQVVNPTPRQGWFPHGSDDDLPDMDTFTHRRIAGTLPGYKRRKLVHSARRENTSNSNAQTNGDEESAPLSPPQSSGDLATHEEPTDGEPAFRMPFGMTSATTALPTPDVSSDKRPIHLDTGDESPDLEMLPRDPRRLMRGRPKSRNEPVGSSPDVSDAPSESDKEEKRLRKAQRRMRGVLPASWLKMDLQSRKKPASPPPPPSPKPFDSTASASRHQPVKGVAQRIRRNGPTPSVGNNRIVISDQDDDDTDQSSQAEHRQPQQSKLHMGRGRGLSVEASDMMDVDSMEFDAIDHMLTGSSSRRQGQGHRSARQPRITDAFHSTRGTQPDFSEERRMPRKSKNTAQGPARQKPNKPRQRNRPTVPRLSIADAPNSLTQVGSAAPQFVRLAMRQARKQPNRGRHSPSQKVLRLATEDDTNDAYASLTAWRGGSIAPRSEPTQVRAHTTTQRTQRPHNQQHADAISQLTRLPLHEIESNEQQRLQTPLRKEQRNSRPRNPNNVAVRRPKKRQTQLQPVVTLDHNDENEDEPPLPTTTQTPVQRRRQPRSQGRPVRYRGAQLETLEHTFHEEHRAAAFERRINCLTENVSRRSMRTSAPELPLSRFLEEPIPPASVQARRSVSESDSPTEIREPQRAAQPRRRKALARRLDVNAREYRQPSEPIPEDFTIVGEAEISSSEAALPVLRDLGSFGTRYATDFDMQPLAMGTFFQQSTFIGSGEFAKSLNFADRDLETPSGHIRIHVDGDVLEWGVWTEEVSSDLTRVPRAIASALSNCTDASGAILQENLPVIQANVDHMLRSTVRYFTRCVSFLDQIDRRSCLQQMQRFAEEVIDLIGADSDNVRLNRLRTMCLQYAVIIAKQAHLLAAHPIVPVDLRQKMLELLLYSSQKLSQHVFPSKLHDSRLFYEANMHSSKREAGISDEDTSVLSTALLNHTACKEYPHGSTFWGTIYSSFNVDTSQLSSAPAMDKVWYDIFTILPSLELDKTGITRPGQRLIETQEDWSLVKSLVERLFALYETTSMQRGSTVNDYARATLTRCYRLVTRWGWWRCEPILSTVFDFFARRGLAPLHNEESRGSPRFLSECGLHGLEVQAEDRSFHIFLKTLAIGLRGMRGRYADKKIGGIAWRFIPNHGRTYPKDVEIRQTDLDALRNHHDLLCTLYFSTPPKQRLRIDLVRNLVDHNSSHREACRLNVRAWTNITCFQAASDESVEALVPLTDWFREMMRITISQYRVARVEAEQDFAVARDQGAIGITESMMNATILSNQRQIAATVVDALAGLKNALRGASSMEMVLSLIEGTSFWSLFLPFDPSERRLYTALEEALKITEAALDAQRRFRSTTESQITSEESQEYGDSTALQELAITQDVATGSQSSAFEILHGPVGQLISNLLGADDTVDDALLTKTIDVWVQLAQASVQSGKSTWNSYVDDYGPSSWNQLRDTDQRRKFTPYFLAGVVNHADDGFMDLGQSVLTAWVVSLVDREATLKYQHTLTSALLNQHWPDPLLDNLPFTPDGRSGKYDISLHELRSRRMVLISSILSNMRDSFNDNLHHHPHRLQEARKVYGDLLRRLMRAMKTNYQELQATNNENIASSVVQGSYVEFVQQIVSFFQQYTADICRIDPFFTDSSAFPLPADDPTYVVGRLRSYVSKLSESKVRKQLVVFVHTVCERAAVDNEQPYLVEQLSTAMSNGTEYGQRATTGLYHVVLSTIFPAYIEGALSRPCAWILALPILQACERIIGKLLYNIDMNDIDSVEAALESVGSITNSLQQPLEWIVMHPDWMRLPHVCRMLALSFDVCRSMLTVCEFIKRTTGQGRSILKSLIGLYGFSQEVYTALEDPAGEMLAHFPGNEIESINQWGNTKEFAENHVRAAISNEWYTSEGQYFVRRGSMSKEVVMDLGDEAEERDGLMAAITTFRNSFETIMTSRGPRQPPRWSEDRGSDLASIPV